MTRRGFFSAALRALPFLGTLPVIAMRATTAPPQLWTKLTSLASWRQTIQAAPGTFRAYGGAHGRPIVQGYTRFYGWIEDKAGRVVAYVAQPVHKPGAYYLARTMTAPELRRLPPLQP